MKLNYFKCSGLVVMLLFLGCKKETNTSALPFSSVEFQSFGGSGNDRAVDILSTDDGGFMVLGNTQSTDGTVEGKTTTDSDVWLLKLNAELKLSWQQTYGSTLNDSGSTLLATKDGGWIIVGATQQPTNLDKATDVWLIKIAANGTKLWEKTYGFAGVDIGYDAIVTSEGGLLLAASLDVTASGGAGNQSVKTQKHAGGDYWLLKTDATGNLEWSQYYGGFFTETPCCVIEHPDGGYLLAGSSDSSDVDISNNLGTYDIWLVRVDTQGKLLWDNNFGGQQIESATALLDLKDGNFMLIGTTRSSDQDVTSHKGAADIWAVKIDREGGLLWSKTFGGSNFETAEGAALNSKNQIIIAGNSRSDDGDLSTNNGHNDAWLLVLDAEGLVQQQFSWGETQTDTFNAAVYSDTNIFYVIGTSNSPTIGTAQNYGFTDIFITKFE